MTHTPIDPRISKVMSAMGKKSWQAKVARLTAKRTNKRTKSHHKARVSV